MSDTADSSPRPPHSHLHVFDLLVACAHVRENSLPLERADVLGVFLFVAVQIRHHHA